MASLSTSTWVGRLLPLAAVILMLGLGEAGARFAIWWQYGNAAQGSRVRLDYAPFLLTSGPEASYAFRPRRPGVARVLWCGSSTAMTFTADELAAAFTPVFGHEVEVINVAQEGHTSTQELVMLALYGMQLRPDLIVTLDGINEIVSVSKTGRPGVPYLNLTIEEALETPTTFWLNRLTASSQLLNVFRKMGERRHEMAVLTSTALMAQTVEMYRSNALKMAAIANGIDARYVAMLQPYLHLRRAKTPSEQTLSANWEYRRPYMMDMLTRFHEAMRGASLPPHARYVNGLTTCDDHPETTCFHDEAHLTAEGRRLLLDRLAASLRSDDDDWRTTAGLDRGERR